MARAWARNGGQPGGGGQVGVLGGVKPQQVVQAVAPGLVRLDQVHAGQQVEQAAGLARTDGGQGGRGW